MCIHCQFQVLLCFFNNDGGVGSIEKVTALRGSNVRRWNKLNLFLPVFLLLLNLGWAVLCHYSSLSFKILFSSVAPLKSLYFHWTAICSSSIVFTPRSLFLLFDLLFSGPIVEDLTTAATPPILLRCLLLYQIADPPFYFMNDENKCPSLFLIRL